MNRAYASVAALTIATLSAGHAFAASQQGPLTREQVKAELVEAVRAGNVVADDAGHTLKDLNPSAFPAQTAAAGKTREQVKAELAEAVRAGNVVADDAGHTLKDLNPSAFPAQTAAAGKTREQVKAELAEAIRTHSLPVVIGG